MIASCGLAKWIGGIAALLLLALPAHAEAGEPFGLPTEAAAEGSLPAIWRTLQSQMQAEQPIIARCRAEPDACAFPEALRLLTIVNEGKNHQGLSRVGRINRAANFSLQAFGRAVPERIRRTWTSPLAALAVGIGDCKQYAMVKYAALGQAGFAPDDLRVVIVRIKPLRIDHAAVAVRHAGRWYIADNRSLAIVDSGELYDYLPLYSLDHRGVRRYMLPPGAPVAAAPCDRKIG